MTLEQLTIGRNLLRSIEETNNLIAVLNGVTSIGKCRIYLDDKFYIHDVGECEKGFINFQNIKDHALSYLEKRLQDLNEEFEKL